MKKLVFVVLISLALIALPMLASAGGLGKPVTLKIPSAFPDKLPMLNTINYFAKVVQKASAGNIKVKVYAPGKLVPAFEIYGAVSSGQVNAGYTASMYLAGKIPAAALFTAVPFGPNVTEYLAWFYNGNGLKLEQEMYDKNGYNLKVFPLVFMSPESGGWFRKPINSVADLKGLRLRFPGLAGMVLTKLGASVSAIPGKEIFPALEKGAIDGTEFSQPAIDAKLGFWKVAKYNYFPSWHQTATMLELVINKDTWNKMSPAQQTLIETAVRASNTWCIALSESAQTAALKANEKHGAKNMIYPPDVLQALKKTWQQVIAEETAKDPFFKKAWDDLTAFMADYRIWWCHSAGVMPGSSCK